LNPISEKVDKPNIIVVDKDMLNVGNATMNLQAAQLQIDIDSCS
jgi:hypothetical protein